MTDEKNEKNISNQERNPFQPMVLKGGVLRFRENKIVSDLLDFATPLGFDMNHIAIKEYSQTDREQFYQLIGYSLCGFHELSYVSDKTAKKASKLAKKVSPIARGCRDNNCEIHIGVEQK